mgnify:CR=1 FL=1
MFQIDRELFKHLSSAQNQIVKKIRTLQSSGIRAAKSRHQDHLALIDGVHLIQSWNLAKNAETRIKSIFTTESGLQQNEVVNLLRGIFNSKSSSEIHFYLIEESLWRELSDLDNAPHILGLVSIPEAKKLPELNEDCIILDAIQDSGNVGSILRTAAAAGFRKIICIKGTAQVWSPKVLRSGMGAHTALEIFEGVEGAECLAKVHSRLLTTQLHGNISLYKLKNQLSESVAWIFGNEGSGVSQEFIERSCGVLIPQEQAVESLNVSAAAAICLFETRRIRLEALG